MAAGRPAGADLQKHGVVTSADINGSRTALHLSMAAETEVVVGLGEHHAIDGAVWIVAGGATFAQGRVFKDKWPRLLAMALGTGFVLSRHGQASLRFEAIFAMRVMALSAVHVAFDDGMMHGHLKFRARGQVTAQARFGDLAGIDDEFTDAAAGFHVFAAGPMAGFTPGVVLQIGVFQT